MNINIIEDSVFLKVAEIREGGAFTSKEVRFDVGKIARACSVQRNGLWHSQGTKVVSNLASLCLVRLLEGELLYSLSNNIKLEPNDASSRLSRHLLKFLCTLLIDRMSHALEKCMTAPKFGNVSHHHHHGGMRSMSRLFPFATDYELLCLRNFLLPHMEWTLSQISLPILYNSIFERLSDFSSLTHLRISFAASTFVNSMIRDLKHYLLPSLILLDISGSDSCITDFQVNSLFDQFKWRPAEDKGGHVNALQLSRPCKLKSFVWMNTDSKVKHSRSLLELLLIPSIETLVFDARLLGCSKQLLSAFNFELAKHPVDDFSSSTNLTDHVVQVSHIAAYLNYQLIYPECLGINLTQLFLESISKPTSASMPCLKLRRPAPSSGSLHQLQAILAKTFESKDEIPNPMWITTKLTGENVSKEDFAYFRANKSMKPASSSVSKNTSRIPSFTEKLIRLDEKTPPSTETPVPMGLNVKPKELLSLEDQLMYRQRCKKTSVDLTKAKFLPLTSTRKVQSLDTYFGKR